MSKKNHFEEDASTDSEKKDPELFENEPMDLQPSRKGRIVSTLIVIVVAILVIWVFARNNEEPKNETANEVTAQEETAAAEPLDETANPEDQLAQLKSEFNDSWQAATDEISRATEMAVTNFDDKKTAALERLNDVSANLQTTATKAVDQGLASAKSKVESLGQTNLKSLAALQTKIEGKTTVTQLEHSLGSANDQLTQAQDQVMAAINDNTEKLTTTIDQAVAKALEQDETAKQQLAEQTRTETEVTVTEKETIATAESVTELPAEKEVTVTGDGVEVTAETGDSITKLARKALTEAMNSGKVSKDLSAEQRIYIEDYLQNRTGNYRIAVGDSQTFSTELINEAVDHAKNLSDTQLEHLKIYSSQVSF